MNMVRSLLLIFIGGVLLGLGACKQGWWLLLAWIGLSFLWLGVAHAIGWHRAFGKRSDGTLPLWSKLLHLPLLAYTSLFWHLLRLFSQRPAQTQVTEQLVIGRRLLALELKEEYVNYIDLTAEFQEPAAIRRQAGYFCFPILDASAPAPEAMRLAIDQLRPGKTYVHCAQGYGRTGLFALAMLLSSRTVKDIAEGLQMLKKLRPGIRLNAVQLRCIEAYAHTLKSESPSS